MFPTALGSSPHYLSPEFFAYSAFAAMRIGDVGVDVFPQREEVLLD
jgi:hypothetical protein